MTTVALFGEILLRLSPPGNELPFQSPSFRTYVGGAEANVGTQLGCLGHSARMLSAVPDNTFGHGVCSKLREHGVDTSHVLKRDGRLGLYLVTVGAGQRSTHVVYDRDATSFQRTHADEWNWSAMLAGVSWLHVSGINAALGEQTEKSLSACIDAARERDITVSFDCNYRSTLWEARGCDPVPILKGLIGKAQFLFANHRDVSLLSGKDFNGEGTDRRRAAAEEAFAMFPGLTGIASTARHSVSADHHRLSARIDRPNNAVQADEVDITRIEDRIGSGDGFCAGVLDALLRGESDEVAAQTGLAVAVLKHSLPGDAALFGREDIAAFMAGQHDVRR